MPDGLVANDSPGAVCHGNRSTLADQWRVILAAAIKDALDLQLAVAVYPGDSVGMTPVSIHRPTTRLAVQLPQEERLPRRTATVEWPIRSRRSGGG